VDLIICEFIKLEFEPEISNHDYTRDDEGGSSSTGEITLFGNLMFLHLDIPVRSQHSRPNNKQVERDSERPFFSGPINPT